MTNGPTENLAGGQQPQPPVLQLPAYPVQPVLPGVPGAPLAPQQQVQQQPYPVQQQSPAYPAAPPAAAGTASPSLCSSAASAVPWPAACGPALAERAGSDERSRSDCGGTRWHCSVYIWSHIDSRNRCGHIALVQTKKKQERGTVFAVCALAAGYLMLFGGVLAFFMLSLNSLGLYTPSY